MYWYHVFGFGSLIDDRRGDHRVIGTKQVIIGKS